MELAGAVALVTGASRGIGRAIAMALAREGATVACVARTLEGPPRRGSLRATVDAIEKEGGRADAFACDVTQAAPVRDVVGQVTDRFGGIDLLVNNAGVYTSGRIADLDPADWEHSLAVNLTGSFLFCRYVLLGMMKRRRGNILNISSGSARGYDPGHVAYSVAKAGLERLTINLAEEVRRHGIAVNALAPGLVATEMTDGAGDPPERVVPAALWLLSRDASQFTGRVVARGEFGATWGEGVSGA